MASLIRCQGWNRLSLAFVCMFLAAMVVFTSCSPSPAPLPAPAPTPTPQLNELSFSLSVEPPQEYDEYTMPIYIRSHQTLHLNWRITKGGDSLWIAVTTPSGKVIGMRADGGFNNYATCERLIGMGNIIFTPSEYDWGEGYYLFRPHIGKGDAATTVEVLYWIED